MSYSSILCFCILHCVKPDSKYVAKMKNLAVSQFVNGIFNTTGDHADGVTVHDS